ncbi:hypothetical protein [Bythopirellula polymerisocia]|uniref:Uncharacterized protein n=1 Tax=Bythopirellula polymerisocia TaxID=2528003 RepID=A0A5C6CT41_9BACT|nr:hypothetical protein [Bythopirellula polymerisocia]TWU27558.1 hypothetical protein Pla144_23350 [Bythopirellula polymerisocia]
MEDRSNTDWSFIDEQIRKKDSEPRDALIPTANRQSALAESKGSISMQVPELSVPDGLLSQFKANQIKRKSALEALQTHYGSQIDVLKHTLSRAAQVEKSRADVTASQFLKELDSKYLEVLAQLGMRNKDTREKAILDLTDQTTVRLREVAAKDWPQQFKDSIISELMSLHQRYIDEIVAELGSDYAGQ